MNSSKKYKIDKYKNWIKQIHSEILDLNTCCIIWEKITEIENHSQHFIMYGGYFQEWQNQNFFYKVIIQLSRIVEPSFQKDDRSLYNLLVELRDNNFISYSQYKTNYLNNNGELLLGYCEKDLIDLFEKTTKQKYTDSCFCLMINQDLTQLKKIHTTVRQIRNKMIAHLTKQTHSEVDLKYSKLKNFISILDKMFNNYSELLFGYLFEHEYTDLNIEKVFEEAWIKA